MPKLMATSLIALLRTEPEKINAGFSVWHDNQTFSDQREECFEAAYQDLGLKEPSALYPSIEAIPHIIKVYILYFWFTTDSVQGERIHKASKNKIKTAIQRHKIK